MRASGNLLVFLVVAAACPSEGPGTNSATSEASSTSIAGTGSGSTAAGTTASDPTSGPIPEPTTTTTSGATTGSTTSAPNTSDDPATTTTTATTDPSDTSAGSTSSSTTMPPPGCGDGVLGPGEQCDDRGESAQCDLDCTDVSCGDEQVNETASEQCDDGGFSGSCDDDCTFAVCGDGVLNEIAGEQCDDGNVVAHDGCSAECGTESEAAFMVLGMSQTGMVFADGTFRRWGRNNLGQLGYGHVENLGDNPGEVPSPNLPVGGPVIDASTGEADTCAVVAGGNVHCWGSNKYGSLGSGSVEPLGDEPGELPTVPVEVGAPAVQVSVGQKHGCVVTQAGGVRCWGSGASGKLGYGNTNQIGAAPGQLPVPDVALGGKAKYVAAGVMHTCALMQDGTVRCWGNNDYGELGLEHIEQIGDEPGEMPPPVTDLGGVATQLALGDGFSCAVMQGGKVKCWGLNEEGQCGQGDTLLIGWKAGDMPPPDVDVGGVAVQLAVGLTHSCALLDNGKVRCWGSGNHGYPGLGPIGDDPGEMPPADLDLGGIVSSVALHQGDHSCVLFVDKTMRCWGSNLYGAFGIGNTKGYGIEPPSAVPLVPY